MSIGSKTLVLVITSIVIISVPAMLAVSLSADQVTEEAVDSSGVGIMADNGLLSAASSDMSSIIIYYEDLASYEGIDIQTDLGGISVMFLETVWPEIAQAMDRFAVSNMSITAAIEGSYEVNGRSVDRYVINTYMGDQLVDLTDLGLAEQVRIIGTGNTSLLAVFSEAGTVIAEGSVPLSYSGGYNLGYVNDSDGFGMLLTAIFILFVASIPVLAYYSYKRNKAGPEVVVQKPAVKYIYCPDCGMNIDPTFTFCIHCGLSLKKAVA